MKLGYQCCKAHMNLPELMLYAIEKSFLTLNCMKQLSDFDKKDDILEENKDKNSPYIKLAVTPEIKAVIDEFDENAR